MREPLFLSLILMLNPDLILQHIRNLGGWTAMLIDSLSNVAQRLLPFPT